MRFDSIPRATPRPITPRRLKAAERALKREQERHPLFSEQVAEEQPTAEERIQQIESEATRYWQRIRDHTARTWIKARRILFSLPEDRQRELLERWNNGPWPGTAEYFADFIYRETGRSASRE